MSGPPFFSLTKLATDISWIISVRVLQMDGEQSVIIVGEFSNGWRFLSCEVSNGWRLGMIGSIIGSGICLLKIKLGGLFRHCGVAI